MKVLVIRLSSVGDIILTSLAVRALRNAFPEAALDVLVKESFAPLYTFSPHVDTVRTIPDNAGLNDAAEVRRSLMRIEYDIVVDLHNSLRSRLIRFGLGSKRYVFGKPTLRKRLLVATKINLLRPIRPIPLRYLDACRPLNLTDDGKGLELFSKEPSVRVDTMRVSHHPIVALATGARHATKRWPPERFAELGRRIVDKLGGSIVLLGSPEESELCGEIERAIDRPGSVRNVAGAGSILDAADIISQCDLVVANDSALAHVAAARKKPAVSIFGSTVEEFGFVPFGTAVRVVQVDGLSCRPCTSIGRDDCPLGHFKCMRLIAVDDVMSAVESLLKETSATRGSASPSRP